MEKLKLGIKNNIDKIIIFILINVKLCVQTELICKGIPKKPIFINLIILVFIYFLFGLFIKRRKIYFLYFMDFLISFMLLANIVFYRAYNDFITLGLLKEINQLGDVKQSIIYLFKPIDLIYVIDLFLLPLLYRYRNTKHEDKGFLKRLKYLAVSFVLLCACMGYVYFNTPYIFGVQYSRPIVVAQAGMIGMFAIDEYHYFENNFVVGKITDQDKSNIKNQLNNDNVISGKYKGKNLIMIQVESLQQFVINRTYDGKEITPNLNKLIQESVYFDNCYYQVGLGHTCDAELLTNAGLYPAKDSAAFITKYNNTYSSISQGMKELGYNTDVFHGNNAAFWNRSAMYKDFKYDEFYSLEKLTKDNMIGMGLSDESLFRQASDIINNPNNAHKPFFSFLITLTSHGPFDYGFHDFCGNSNIIENYYNCINYTDKSLGMFIDKLKKSGVLDNSILVIYGDHNSIGYPDKNLFEKAVGEKINDSGQWQQYQKVPMIIRFPNGENSGVNEKSVGQIDVYSTVASLFGIKDGAYFGRNMFEEGNNLVVLRDGSYVFGDENYNAKENKTYNMKDDSITKNNPQLINKAKAQLEASDKILEYNYFKKSK